MQSYGTANVGRKKIRKYFMVIISFLVAYRHWPGKTTIPSWF